MKKKHPPAFSGLRLLVKPFIPAALWLIVSPCDAQQPSASPTPSPASVQRDKLRTATKNAEATRSLLRPVPSSDPAAEKGVSKKTGARTEEPARAADKPLTAPGGGRRVFVPRDKTYIIRNKSGRELGRYQAGQSIVFKEVMNCVKIPCPDSFGADVVCWQCDNPEASAPPKTLSPK